MTENFRPPCVNGCTRTGDDGQPQPLLATFGRYCARCFHRTDEALLTAGILARHLVENISARSAAENDGSKRTKKAPPLPLNVAAFDDANEIYSSLVYWSSVWATRLNRQMPGPARRAWRNDHNTIIGLPADITPTAAHQAVGTIAKWLSINLPDMFRHPFTADIDEFRAAAEDVYRIMARWPMEEHPRYVPLIQCWIPVEDQVCNNRIKVFPPKFAGADRIIRCDYGHVFPEDEYDRMSGLFRQIRKDQAAVATKEHRRALVVAQKLAKKYSAGT